MAEETKPSGEPIGAAAAAAVAPDPETAALLEKHAAWKAGTGEKPTQQEFGKIGVFAKWLKNPFGKSSAEAKPAGPTPGPGQPAPVAALASPEASPDSLAPVEVDDGLCRRTTAAVLSRADAW